MIIAFRILLLCRKGNVLKPNILVFVFTNDVYEFLYINLSSTNDRTGQLYNISQKEHLLSFTKLRHYKQ